MRGRRPFKSHRQPGRLKIKMAELLTKAGFPTEPEDVWAQEGAYRIHGTESRWGASSRRDSPPGNILLACWDAMTACAKLGLTVYRDDRDGWVISAREELHS